MSFLRLLIAGLLLASAAAAPGADAPGAGPRRSARALVAAYNARDFGSPGWRRVVLELQNDGKVIRTFSIFHLWREQQDEVRSLVLLEAPAGLRGTDYLLTESPRRPVGMELYLHLPAGERQVLSIKPSRFEQGLLGSDFTYSDLRWRIPTAGYRLDVVGRGTLLGRPVWKIEATPVNPAIAESSSWGVLHYYLCQDPPLLLGADFYRRRGMPPDKRLRILSFEQRGRVWTPNRMIMEVSKRRSSTLRLAESGFGAGPDRPELFLPEALPKNADRLLASGASDLLRERAP